MKIILSISLGILFLCGCIGNDDLGCKIGTNCSYYDSYGCQKEDGNLWLTYDCGCENGWDTIDFTIDTDSIFVSTIEHIEASCLPINGFPEMPNLEYVYLKGDFFPVSLKNAPRVNYFQYELEGADTYPKEFYNWTELEYLSIENDVNSFEPGFERYSNLKTFYIYGSNTLTALPDSLPASLESVAVFGDNLVDISSLGNHLTQLEELTIRGIMTSIPSSIESWSKLEDLQVKANLTSLPNEIGNLVSLDRLQLDENQLTTIPSSIANLKDNLRILSLVGNPIDSTTRVNLNTWLPNTIISF